MDEEICVDYKSEISTLNLITKVEAAGFSFADLH